MECIPALPGGEAARPVHHYSVIWNVFLRLLSAGEVLTSEARPSMDRDNVKLDISEDPVINAYGGPDGIQINLAVAELLADSESELAFLIGHELGHVYQFRTGKRIFDPNRELDADVWGLFLSLIAGYDPYAVAGTLAKMVMANGQADLQSQYTLEFSRTEHGSFNNPAGPHLRHYHRLLQQRRWIRGMQPVPRDLPSASSRGEVSDR